MSDEKWPHQNDVGGWKKKAYDLDEELTALRILMGKVLPVVEDLLQVVENCKPAGVIAAIHGMTVTDEICSFGDETIKQAQALLPELLRVAGKEKV